MAIVADSSPLIALVKIARLDLLRTLYEAVLIPGSVHHEVIVEGKRLRKPGAEEIENGIKAGWINVVTFTKEQSHDAQKYRTSAEIASSEAEAVTLARSRTLPIILDDRNARQLSAALGMEFIGTGAVLLEARLRGILRKTEFAESLRELGKVMWLSPEVVAELLRLAEE